MSAVFGTYPEAAGAEGGSGGAGAEADGAPTSSAAGTEGSTPSSVAISTPASLSFRLATFSFTRDVDLSIDGHAQHWLLHHRREMSTYPQDAYKVLDYNFAIVESKLPFYDGKYDSVAYIDWELV